MKINDAFDCLRSTFIEWDGFLVNNRYIKKSNTEITWEGHQNIDFAYPITTSYILKLIEIGQFSFQIGKDGSIFQIYYAYDRRGKNICKSSLSFFYLGSVIDQEILEEYDFLEYLPDKEVGWFRIDYDIDSSHYHGVVHAKSHMHLGLFPDTRLVVDRLLNPKQFVEFVISTCYPDYYKSTRLDEQDRFKDLAHICTINDPLLPESHDDDLCGFVPHLRIPNRIAVDNHTKIQQVRKRGKKTTD